MKQGSDSRRRSLLMTSVGSRVAVALVVVAAIWLAVGWAVGMPS